MSLIKLHMGFRNGGPLRGQVHDDNAFVIDEFCTHAGLFSTVKMVCVRHFSLDKKFSLIKLYEIESFLSRKRDPPFFERLGHN